jgi:hypothetical protein
MVFRTWDLNFGAWEILGYVQDMVFRTWDLNFGAWIFTLSVSKIETFRMWFSRCGISILGPGFHSVRRSRAPTGDFTVAFGHSHPLVKASVQYF